MVPILASRTTLSWTVSFVMVWIMTVSFVRALSWGAIVKDLQNLHLLLFYSRLIEFQEHRKDFLVFL